MYLAAIYQNLRFDDKTLTLGVIIWGLCAGIIIGAAISYYHKIYLGKIVRALLKEGIHDRENAVTLAELGLKENVFYRFALQEGKSLRRCIEIANPDESIREVRHNGFVRFMKKLFTHSSAPGKRTDVNVARLYIPEEEKYRADARFEKKGPEGIMLILCVVLVIGAGVGLTKVIPVILNLLDDVITLYKGLF